MGQGARFLLNYTVHCEMVGMVYYQDATDTGQQRKGMPTRARRGRINVDVVVDSPAVLS
jgi:hypothetical protein